MDEDGSGAVNRAELALFLRRGRASLNQRRTAARREQEKERGEHDIFSGGILRMHHQCVCACVRVRVRALVCGVPSVLKEF